METNVTDEEIAIVFSNTNFGHTNYRQLLEQGCLKRLVPYHSGWTLTQILRELGLTTSSDILTDKGRKFLYAAFQNMRYEP